MIQGVFAHHIPITNITLLKNWFQCNHRMIKKINLSSLDSMTSCSHVVFYQFGWAASQGREGWEINLQGQREDMEHITWGIYDTNLKLQLP